MKRQQAVGQVQQLQAGWTDLMTMRGVGVLGSRESIAIIGMTGRFPGARTLEDLWRALVEGRETVRGTLDGAFEFDAEYFRMTPRDAELMDPQQRLMLEAAVHVLEDAGIDPARFAGDIGVYCGKGTSEYLTHNVLGHQDRLARNGRSLTDIATEMDSVASRLAKTLDLRGPTVSVNSAGCTSLVAVSLAVDALRLGRCDAALAGGVCIHLPQDGGDLADVRGGASDSGDVEALAAGASAALRSSGLGLVVLKRLADALRDRDPIRAVILGIGIDHEGIAPRSSIGPSRDCQAGAVRKALRDAGVSPRCLDLLEAHGTATLEGDRAELAELVAVFRESTEDRSFCALGSLKRNVGHLDAVSGVAGLIKVALSLERELVPPMLDGEDPDVSIDLERTPFFVPERALEWKRGENPRRAGVSALGIGGSNAHAVLQEAPALHPSGPSRPVQLIVQSARSSAALERATRALGSWLADRAEQLPANDLADVAYTLQSGRTAHAHRRFALGESARELARALHDGSPDRVVTATSPTKPPRVAFLFPGQGAQYVNMGAGLYAVEPLFRTFVDECAELLAPHLGQDIRELLLTADVTARHLRQTRLTQPAVFVVEHSLARLWQAWGVQPDELVGHSIGQYVAACLAGVLSLPDALAVVAKRGTLMQELPPGTMLSVRLPEEELAPLLGEQVSLAAVNAPGLCVVSGPGEAIDELARNLKVRHVACRRLDTSHAFHCSMMEPMIVPIREFLSGIELSPPRIPVLCTTTGRLLSDEDACNPSYWACHVRDPVRFGAAVSTLWEDEQRVVLEVGPGRMLATLARQQISHPATQAVVSSLLETPDANSECLALLHAVGQLWSCGVQIDWAAFHGDEQRRTVSLPGYPFEPTRHWLAPAMPAARDLVPVMNNGAAAFQSADLEHLTRRLDQMSRQIASLRQGDRAASGADAESLPARPVVGAPDPARPPLPDARVGRAADGRSAWFVPDPARPGRYLQVVLEA